MTLTPMDVYLASMGRSGSTLIANWLTVPDQQIILVEPEFPKGLRHRSLMKQCEALGFPISEDEWSAADSDASARIERILGPRLRDLRWGVKEVQCGHHEYMIEKYKPVHTLVT